MYIMVFYIFCTSSIIFEHVIYPQKSEVGLLLLFGCLVVLREAIAQAVKTFYSHFLNVCMSMFSQVVRFWIVLISSHSCIVVLRQVNIAVVATALFVVYSTYTLS